MCTRAKNVLYYPGRKGTYLSMNAFENIAIGLLQGAEVEAPLFVKSAQGTVILNASEILLGSILARFAPAPAATTAPAPTAPTA